ncbi:MAG TPA: hypothetical protein VJ124_01540 [Pyrinomonadaceae bacterium]|nr:hypothetical protein [Pyrinomonadaceae bacterium]
MVKQAALMEIETERLFLRQFEWEDLEDLVRIRGDARVMKYVGRRDGKRGDWGGSPQHLRALGAARLRSVGGCTQERARRKF